MKKYIVSVRSPNFQKLDIIYITASCRERARLKVLAMYEGWVILHICTENSNHKYFHSFTACNMNEPTGGMPMCGIHHHNADCKSPVS